MTTHGSSPTANIRVQYPRFIFLEYLVVIDFVRGDAHESEEISLVRELHASKDF
jgi:hypothetical protein